MDLTQIIGFVAGFGTTFAAMSDRTSPIACRAIMPGAEASF